MNVFNLPEPLSSSESQGIQSPQKSTAYLYTNSETKSIHNYSKKKMVYLIKREQDLHTENSKLIRENSEISVKGEIHQDHG